MDYSNSGLVLGAGYMDRPRRAIFLNQIGYVLGRKNDGVYAGETTANVCDRILFFKSW